MELTVVMDAYQAIQDFWESFGLEAYDENTVPTGDYKPELPYITYDASVSDFNYPVSMHASIWYYGTSWAKITEKLKEITTAISRGGVNIPTDNGTIWITKGRPFAQRMSDPDDMIRRIYINVVAEFITVD